MSLNQPKDYKEALVLSRAIKRYGASEVIRRYEGMGEILTEFRKPDGGILVVGTKAIQKEVSEFMKMIEAYPANTDSPKRIAFLIESFFLSNVSGIYTFVKHFSKMCADHNVRLDLIMDTSYGFEAPKELNSDHVSLFASPRMLNDDCEYVAYGLKFEDDVRVKAFTTSLAGYCEEFDPIMVVSHSYATTKVLKALKTKSRKVAYTHIGDIMDANNTELLDFSSDLTRAYIELLSTLDFEIGTQTTSSKEALEALMPEAKVTLLPEPFYVPKVVYQTADKRKGILIISSNYDRKRFDKMFEIIAITGLPVTVCAGYTGEGEHELEAMAKAAGVQGFRLLKNVPNDYLTGIIRQHKVLLHLSEIEVMPYAILEASVHIPCVVNGNAKWAQGDLPCPVTKVDIEDIFDCVMKITEAYGDSFEYRGLDVDAYSQNAEKVWLGVE